MRKILSILFLTIFVCLDGNAQINQNKIGDKIYGDFDGDGKIESAFRVLTKKGQGNPVENGTPDKYEIHFSNKNINPIKVNCCWFKLINEGDLDEDGADEITIVQSPENGCIGTVSTFTIKDKKSNLLFKPFLLFICAELSDKELQKLIVTENNIIYYHEADPNDENLLNDSGDKINFLRLKKTVGLKLKVDKIKTTNEVLQSLSKGNGEELPENKSINNLKDLLAISELTLKDMVLELQYTWKVHPPQEDFSEKGYITERYIFSYNRNAKKQILKKCGRMDLSTRRSIWLTNFQSNDLELLNRIIKNLPYQGFELKNKQKSNSMYEDGNRIIIIQTQSDLENDLPKGSFSINVIVG